MYIRLYFGQVRVLQGSAVVYGIGNSLLAFSNITEVAIGIQHQQLAFCASDFHKSVFQLYESVLQACYAPTVQKYYFVRKLVPKIELFSGNTSLCFSSMSMNLSCVRVNLSYVTVNLSYVTVNLSCVRANLSSMRANLSSVRGNLNSPLAFQYCELVF